jgi:MFS family permease
MPDRAAKLTQPPSAEILGGTRVEQPGLLGWYQELTGTERRAFWACFGGWSLDAMDANLYGFVIPTLMGLWKMTGADAGLLASAALLSSAAGGWLSGVLADRIGRVRMLQLTIVWFAVFTAMSALTHSFNELLVVRVLQGFGFGGEWSVGAVLIGEIIRDKHRGKANGIVHSGYAVGWGAAALIYVTCFSLLPPDVAWRVLFSVGALPALSIFFLRRLVEEPEIFRRERQRSVAAGEPAESLAIFGPDLLKTTLLASILAVGAQGGYYAIMIWLPTYLKVVRGLSVLNTGGYLAVIIVASFVGYVVSAYITDIIGRRQNLFLFSICSVVTVAFYMLVPIGDTAMLLLGFPLGFFASGIYSGIGAFFTELYPTRVRGSGIGFCFNFGRAVGASFPTLIGVLSATIPLGRAIGIFSVSAYGLIVLAALFLPETKGRSLQDA